MRRRQEGVATPALTRAISRDPDPDDYLHLAPLTASTASYSLMHEHV